MSKVGAISGATSSQMEELNAKAKEMGATTKFIASEAGEAFTYMAMAGWKTEDMLGGIEGIMSLVAASGESLATTSDIATDTLTAFGMKASESGHFADGIFQCKHERCYDRRNIQVCRSRVRFPGLLHKGYGIRHRDHGEQRH